jgi:hypothetical protein
MLALVQPILTGVGHYNGSIIRLALMAARCIALMVL